MAHDDLTFSQFFKICLPCHIRVSCKDKVGFRREHGKSQRLHLCHEGLSCLYDPRSRIVKVLHIFQRFCSRQDRQAIEIIRVETELDPIEIFDDLLIGNGKPYTCSRKTSRLGKIVTLSFLGSSIPGFFLAMLLIYLFTVKLGWLPSGGMTTLGTSGGAADVAAHMVMPVIVLAVSMAGTNIRYIRSAVLEILQQDYLRTARAKGIGHFLVINKHALRNALVPIVTVIGMEIPVLFGGSIIVEQVFSWPGLGLMTMSAITNRDYPVIMGVCLLSAIVVLLGNLLTDILYAVVDPTIKLQ